MTGAYVKRFHVLGIPHTVSTPEYTSCAFTQKVVKLCRTLRLLGHRVTHYGHEDSRVDCNEHVAVTRRKHLLKSYGDHDWATRGWPEFRTTDHAYRVFYQNAIAQIEERKEPGDFLMCPFGSAHKPVADAHPDLIAVESGIGYADGSFAKFRIFESYAVMHAHQGRDAVRTASNERWYDAVIPNSFDLSEFPFSARGEKRGHLAFLGRVNSGKGVHVARQVAEATRTLLLVAGAGGGEDGEFVRHVGLVAGADRARLLGGARATLCPSTFLEPFCGVQVESMLCGTPVISSDWGAFAEYNPHGVTGYRCRTFEHFTWAARNADRIDPLDCRAWAERFSIERVAPMYEEYLQSVAEVHGGRGWYAENSGRADLRDVSFAPPRGFAMGRA